MDSAGSTRRRSISVESTNSSPIKRYGLTTIPYTCHKTSNDMEKRTFFCIYRLSFDNWAQKRGMGYLPDTSEDHLALDYFQDLLAKNRTDFFKYRRHFRGKKTKTRMVPQYDCQFYPCDSQDDCQLLPPVMPFANSQNPNLKIELRIKPTSHLQNHV